MIPSRLRAFYLLFFRAVPLVYPGAFLHAGTPDPDKEVEAKPYPNVGPMLEYNVSF